VGISNTRARLQQLYGTTHEFFLVNGASGGLLVKILIPWNEASSTETSAARLANAPAPMLPSAIP
jgi:hypothetical protein